MLAAEAKLEELIEAEITTAITDRIKPGFIGFANTINNQAPNSNPPYKLVVEYNIDGIDATFLFSDEAQKMDPWNGLKGTGLKTAFYSLVNVPEIQGASAGGNDVKFKDEDGNPKSGSGFEWDLMFFGLDLIGSMPSTVEEIIGTEQIMNLDCLTESGIRFQMEITFHFVAAEDQAVPTDLAGVAPTSVDGNDGKITGTTAKMEYKLSTEDTWTTATETEVTGLAAGTYEVRYAAKEGCKSNN